MQISKEQMKSILANAPMGSNPKTIVEKLIERGYDIEGLDTQITNSYRNKKRVEAESTGNRFEEQPKNFWQKARDFTVGIIGGGKVAEGAGMAIAAPSVQEKTDVARENITNTQTQLLQRIKEKEARGEDTSRLRTALEITQQELGGVADVAQDFTEALPTSKEVIGSAARLATTAATPFVAGKAAQLTNVGQAATATSGALRGAGAGAITGATTGVAQGAGLAAEQDASGADIAKAGVVGGLGGGILGGAIGAVTGAISGGLRGAKSLERKIEYVTPEARQITPKEYKRLVAQGRIQPKTATEPAKYILTDDEVQIATKYADKINKDPVKTVINLTDEIEKIDADVGTFLKNNNSIYNKGELRNYLAREMQNVDDISVDEARVSRLRETLVNNFVDSLEKNDQVSLWKARKAFDRQAEAIFRGSPTLQKEAKRALRNAVQDFISDATPDDTYKSLMKEMTGLFRLQDSVLVKASSERSRTALENWIKNNPRIAQAIGLAGAGFIGAKVFGGSANSEN